MKAKEYLDSLFAGSKALSKDEEEAVGILITSHKLLVDIFCAFMNMDRRLWFLPRFVRNWIIFGSFKPPIIKGINDGS